MRKEYDGPKQLPKAESTKVKLFLTINFRVIGNLEIGRQSQEWLFEARGDLCARETPENYSPIMVQ